MASSLPAAERFDARLADRPGDVLRVIARDRGRIHRADRVQRAPQGNALGKVAGRVGGECDALEGEDELLEAFGMEGDSLPILEAHAAALTGETVTFSLRGVDGRIWCRVAPTHDAGMQIVGTFCIATEPVDEDGDEPVAAEGTLSLV